MIGTHNCLVLDMKLDGRLPVFGKHEAHPPHDWWYTPRGGGHQMPDGWEPDGRWFGTCEAHDSLEGWVKKWHCPGRD